MRPLKVSKILLVKDLLIAYPPNMEIDYILGKNIGFGCLAPLLIYLGRFSRSCRFIPTLARKQGIRPRIGPYSSGTKLS